MEAPRTISQLSDVDILRLASEASQGGEELETARTLLRHEMARRGILDTLETTTGVVDALEDVEGMIEPRHNDSRWAIGSMHDHMHYENGILVEDDPNIVRGEG